MWLKISIHFKINKMRTNPVLVPHPGTELPETGVLFFTVYIKKRFFEAKSFSTCNKLVPFPYAPGK